MSEYVLTPGVLQKKKVKKKVCQSGNVSGFSSVFRRIFPKICKKSQNVTVRDCTGVVLYLTKNLKT